MVKKKFLIKIRVKNLLGSGTYQFEFADDTKMHVSKALMDYEGRSH